MIVTGTTITPVAFADCPLLNSVGVHQPYALRAVVELHTDQGVTGLGETYADAGHLDRLATAAATLRGIDVFATSTMRNRIAVALAGAAGSDRHGLTGAMTPASTVDRVFAPFEVAALDAQGRLLGRPVHDLLGGAVRDRVPFSAYLFYKWAGHPGTEPDRWGPALDPDAIVGQAEAMIAEFGFGAVKLKGGVFPPRLEIDAIHGLRERFPDLPIRIDPNATWTVETAVGVGKELDGVIEYLEDPTAGLAAMAEVARQVSMPLATNMCVVGFDDIAAAARLDSVSVVLSDHHYWGGLRRSQLLGGMCETLGWGLSMHSNSHLAISLAAMVHLAAATPELTYACDTHWPWKTQDVVEGSPLTFESGSVAVPTGPGLGVELDRDRLGELHELYLSCGIRVRDDTSYRRSVEPDYRPQVW